ncbi:MAG: GNAT family N-acetyltransferase [Methanosarcinaceae archaeon]
MNDFLKNDALENQEQMVSRTYVCCYENQFVGFYTLTTDIIEVKYVEKTHRWDDYKYKKYPAIKLARLAVDSRFEGNGVGRLLLSATVSIALNVSKQVGCRYMAVDAKKDAIGFYENMGSQLWKKPYLKTNLRCI